MRISLLFLLLCTTLSNFLTRGQNADNTGKQFWVDYAALGNGQVQGKFTALPSPRTGADHYLEVGFATTAALLPGRSSGEIQTRFNNANRSSFDEADDYSFDLSKTN
jgi:hypothetical protein